MNLRQYPLPREAVEGIYKHLTRLSEYDIITPIQSPWNTPLLPVKKGGKDGSPVDYRPVQDLRAVNEATVTIHPTVPNPYTLLGLIPPEAKVFTVLDLKDAFFSLRLAESSRPIFAFQWEHPETGRKSQHTWGRLPQGFKNSPSFRGCPRG